MLHHCRRFISLGFVSLIEPTQPPGFGRPKSQILKRIKNKLVDNFALNEPSKMGATQLMHSHRMKLSNSLTIMHDKYFPKVITLHSCFALPNCTLKTWTANNIPEKLDKGTKPAAAISEEPEVDESKLSLFQRFKLTYKKHGKILLAVHIATSAVWFGSFYYVARSGIDVVSLMEHYNFPEKLIGPFKHAGLGDLAVMYLLYKVATPIRYTVTLGCTNVAIRYLKSTGYIKPIPPEDSIRGLMKDGSEILKEKRTEIVAQSKERINTYRGKEKDTKN